MMAVRGMRLSDGERVWIDDGTGEVINVDRAWQKHDRLVSISRRQQALLAGAAMDGPEARWYVLEVMNGFDIAVDKSLEKANIERWMASEIVQPPFRRGRKGPRPEPKTVPFLPGYIFVKVVFCAPCWEALRSLKGVVSVVGGAERPAPVNDADLLKLRAFIERDPEAIMVLTNALRPGDKVRVDSGPFASFPGIVEHVGMNARAIIEVLIFGRSVSVDLELAHISKQD